MTRRKPAKVTVSIRMDPELVEVLDAIAERTDETRSLIAERAIQAGLGAAGEFLSQFDAETKAAVLGMYSLIGLAQSLSPAFGDPDDLTERMLRKAGIIRSGGRREADASAATPPAPVTASPAATPPTSATGPAPETAATPARRKHFKDRKKGVRK